MLDHQVRSVCLVQHCLKLAGRLIHTHGCIPDAADIARFCSGTDPGAAARALTEFALNAGGQDNITVAVVPIGGAS